MWRVFYYQRPPQPNHARHLRLIPEAGALQGDRTRYPTGAVDGPEFAGAIGSQRLVRFPHFAQCTPFQLHPATSFLHRRIQFLFVRASNIPIASLPYRTEVQDGLNDHTILGIDATNATDKCNNFRAVSTFRNRPPRPRVSI